MKVKLNIWISEDKRNIVQGPLSPVCFSVWICLCPGPEQGRGNQWWPFKGEKKNQLRMKMCVGQGGRERETGKPIAHWVKIKSLIKNPQCHPVLIKTQFKLLSKTWRLHISCLPPTSPFALFFEFFKPPEFTHVSGTLQLLFPLLECSSFCSSLDWLCLTIHTSDQISPLQEAFWLP